LALASKDARAFLLREEGPMYPQSSDSVVSAALLVVVVTAASTIVAVAVAVLAWDIARRAIARADADKVPAVLLAMATIIGPLAGRLPWARRTDDSHLLVRDDPTHAVASSSDPEPPAGES
jgi:hypothetical protein